jgi:hypothetical protein
MAASPYSENRHLKMTLTQMLDALPPAWLERYEKTQKVKPYELLEEYKKVEGKNYKLRTTVGMGLGFTIMGLITLSPQQAIIHSKILNTLCIIIFALTALFTMLWILYTRVKDATKRTLDARLENISEDIQTLIKLVGGEGWLNDHGIEVTQIRLAKAIVAEEMAIIELCRRIVNLGIYETPSPVEDLENPISRRRAAEDEYDRATTLIDHFATLPHDFARAKELVVRLYALSGEPETADK